MKHFLIFFLLIASCYVEVNGQYYFDRTKNPDKNTTQKTGRDFDQFYFLGWDTNTPLSNASYISQASSLGTKLGIRKRLNNIDRLWAGAELGWAVYKQYFPSQTFVKGTQSVTTDLYNYAYNYSLAANLDYYFMPMEKRLVPYVGLGIGAAYDNFTQYYNVYGAKTGTFGFLARPEVGILIGLKENSSWRIKAAYHFDYSTNAANLSGNNFIGASNYKNFINTGFQVGLVKMAW